jgi:aminoglycoside 2''-phosphotransferase
MNFNALLKKISEKLPKFEISSVKELGGGWDYRVLLVNGSIAFRFPRKKSYAKSFNAEIRLSKRLRKAGFLVPDYFLVSRKNGLPEFAAYHFIIGDPASKKILGRLSSRGRERVARQLADFLKRLHSFKVGKKSVPQAHFDDQRDLVSLRRRMRKNVYGKISKTKRKELGAEFESLLELQKELAFKPSLCHADLYPHHAIVDVRRERFAGVIDFGDACVGDPAIDFACRRKFPKEFFESVLKRYGNSGEKFLERISLHEGILKLREFYHEKVLAPAERGTKSDF